MDRDTDWERQGETWSLKPIRPKGLNPDSPTTLRSIGPRQFWAETKAVVVVAVSRFKVLQGSGLWAFRRFRVQVVRSIRMSPSPSLHLM